MTGDHVLFRQSWICPDQKWIFLKKSCQAGCKIGRISILWLFSDKDSTEKLCLIHQPQTFFQQRILKLKYQICKQDKVKFYRSVDPALQGIILLVDSLPEVPYLRRFCTVPGLCGFMPDTGFSGLASGSITCLHKGRSKGDEQLFTFHYPVIIIIHGFSCSLLK